MAFNTENFRQSFKTAQTGARATASPAYFEVYLTGLPACLQGKGLEDHLRGLRFRANATDLPGRQFLSEARETRGSQRMMPHSSLYSSQTLEFIETENYDIRHFFDEWHDTMENDEHGNTVRYYDDIIAPSIIILAYNKKGDTVAQWELYDVYPLSVLGSQMSWSSVDSNVAVTVEFHYKKWKHYIMTPEATAQMASLNSRIPSAARGFLQFSGKAKSAVDLLSTARSFF